MNNPNQNGKPLHAMLVAINTIRMPIIRLHWIIELILCSHFSHILNTTRYHFHVRPYFLQVIKYTIINCWRIQMYSKHSIEKSSSAMKIDVVCFHINKLERFGHPPLIIPLLIPYRYCYRKYRQFFMRCPHANIREVPMDFSILERFIVLVKQMRNCECVPDCCSFSSTCFESVPQALLNKFHRFAQLQSNFCNL